MRRDLNAVVAVSEHLGLAFGHLQRIAVVRDAQIGRETELDGQVGVLGLVARNADILLASLGDVVQAARNAVFGIVAAPCEFFELGRVERHHLPHADVPQRNPHVDDQVLGGDAVGIPLRNRVGRRQQRVFLPVVERVGLLRIGYAELAFRLDSGDRLIVQHASVVAEESAVLFRDVDQVRRESSATGSALRVECRVGSSGVRVATAARGAGIQRSLAALRRIVSADARIVVQRVALVEPRAQIARHPIGRRVVGRYARLEHGRLSGRQCPRVGHVAVLVEYLVIISVRTSGKCDDAYQRRHTDRLFSFKRCRHKPYMVNSLFSCRAYSFGEHLSVLPVLEQQQLDGMEAADRFAADCSDVVVDARQVLVGYDRGDVLLV